MIDMSIEQLQKDAIGAGLQFNPDQDGFRILQFKCDPPRQDITLHAVPTFTWPEFGDEAGTPIARDLIRLWNERDWVECPRCQGFGAMRCVLCEGEGALYGEDFDEKTGETRWVLVTCDNCGGTGLVVCGQCMGKGRVPPEVAKQYNNAEGD